MGGLPAQLHLKSWSIFITLTSAGVLAKFTYTRLIPSLLHSRALFSAGGLGLHALLANQVLNLYWCYLPKLTASATEHFIIPLTSLWRKFLKNAQLGTNWEN